MSTPEAPPLQMACGATPLGYIWLLGRHDTLVAAGLADNEPQARAQAQQAAGNRPVAAPTTPLSDLATAVAQWLTSASSPAPDLRAWRLQLAGTAFQQAVWQQLQQIPVGHTISYSELAERVSRRTATRAVASACAANPLAVLVPCHRVVRRDGKLGGYRWGLARKQQLLAQESASGTLAPSAA